MTDPNQSMLLPASSQAAAIGHIWWLFFWLLLAIFAAVMTVMAAGIGSKGSSAPDKASPPEETRRRMGAAVGAASGLTVLILIALIVISLATVKTAVARDQKASVAIEVIGQQWWWYVRYLDDEASRIVVTANEIHVPVGRTVMIRGTSSDVIHSFWAPSMQGKSDLIPTRTTTQWIRAEKPGRYRGQCAEFCGMQHAHMAFWVVAEDENQFEHWRDQQRKPSAEPADSHLARGRQVFMDNACVLCHNIAGTAALGQVGPDLTHFGSRLTIAAGTLPNTPGNLGGWIADPQAIKPGNHMATVPIAAEDLQPLIDYLESLK